MAAVVNWQISVFHVFSFFAPCIAIFSTMRYPSATSSTIITLKPTAKNIVPTFECSPCDISGISSSTTTYSMAPAKRSRALQYYKLSETPAYYITAWYNLLSGKWEFGKVHATETTVEGVTVELTTNGRHTNYEMKLSGFGLDTSTNKAYGVVLTAADGSEYGLRHVANIWHGTKLGFNADDPYFASIIGKTITQITFYAADGVYVLPVNVAL